jgi:hypothetical protein
MRPEIRSYLHEVHAHLNLEPQTERRVLHELYSHLREKMNELEVAGCPEQECAREALDSFGSPRLVARLTYEAFSRGSWVEALVSAQPHLIVTALFLTHYWRRPVFLVGAVALLALTTCLAWLRGKPNWLFSWASYVLISLLAAAYASRRLAGQALAYLLQGEGEPSALWALLPLAGLYALSFWLLVAVTARALRRDWVLASLLLLPLPIAGIWVFNVERLAPLLRSLDMDPHRWDTAMAAVFLVLALASALIVRLRQRVLKVGALLSIGGGCAALVAHSVWSELGLVALAAVGLVVLGFAWSPALLKSRRELDGPEPWLEDFEELAEPPARLLRNPPSRE